MPGQRRRKRQHHEASQRSAARFAPENGRWEVLLETGDESEFFAFVRRIHGPDSGIDRSAVRPDRFCAREPGRAWCRVSLFVPHPATPSDA
ncbi:hypothetical protein [Kitasatospora sp. NPDC057500]|uniref:hypothetical protein n=1 Tax=Kitasatospora sp. NPDC057500 TaxID=3346151 RepID=UPI00369F2A48